MSPRDPSIELSIVLPCLNEAETLETCIRKAHGFLAAHGVAGEVVVADNGSDDGSQEIASSLGARVVDVAPRGYGSALYHGTRAARGRYIIMADADDSYDLEGLAVFLDKLREGYDLVMGNRFRGGVAPGAMPWMNRHVGNPALSGLARRFFHCPVGDLHCGIRGYSADAFERMDLRTTGMEYASEMVIKATLLGMRICEVPTTLRPDGRSRRPHLRPWRDGWRHLRFMLLYSPRWLFLYPGLALMAVGLVLGVWLMITPIRLGELVLDIHSLLYAAAMVSVGFQLVTFSAMAAIYAFQEGLAPPNRHLMRLFRLLTLETALVVGLLLLAGGLVGTGFAIASWRHQGFGALDPSRVGRIVIPSVLALMLGAQVMFNGFFFSVLGLGVRRPDGILTGAGEGP